MVFVKLQQRLWKNRHVPIMAKCKVYRDVVFSCRLYGAEVSTIYRTQVKKLGSFMMRQLRDIMSIMWYDKITNKECQPAVYGRYPYREQSKMVRTCAQDGQRPAPRTTAVLRTGERKKQIREELD